MFEVIKKQIIDLETLLYNTGLLLNSSSLQVSHERDSVFLKLGKSLFSLDAEAFSLEEYVELINKKCYGFLLSEGTALQFYYEFKKKGDLLYKYTLIIYPSPFLIINFDNYELISDFFWEIKDLFFSKYYELICEISQELSNSLSFSANNKLIFPRTYPIRFDFDRDKNTLDHPISHCHILSSNCRIPLSHPLTPFKFIEIAFKLINPSYWDLIKNNIKEDYDFNEQYDLEFYSFPIGFKVK